MGATTVTKPADDGSEQQVDLEALVDEFALLTDSFTDLDFLDPNGRLELNARIPGVTCVRIELPTVQHLHLKTVRLEADGLDRPRKQIRLKASSALNKDYADVLAKRELLDPKKRTLGVYTKADDRPWLELTIDRPVDLRRLVIRNSEDQHAVRARGIQVLVRTEDGWWTTIYDGIERERKFRATVEQHFAGRPLSRRWQTSLRRRLNRPSSAEPNIVEADLVRMLTSIQLRDYGNVFKDFDRIRLPKEQKSDFRRLITDRIALPRQLEWNIHGIKRSFRFWSEQEKKDYLGFAIEVIDSLKQLNDNVCFGFGSVFSVVRDHDLIPHDDDLDVLIGFDPDQATSLKQGLALLEECLRDSGFVVTGNFTSYRWVFPRGGEGPKLDAFVGLFEGDAISWYPGKRGALTREMMFPPIHRELLGFDCAVPNQPETYLEQVYGPDWATPNPHFRHTWRRREYADILS